MKLIGQMSFQSKEGDLFHGRGIEDTNIRSVFIRSVQVGQNVPIVFALWIGFGTKDGTSGQCRRSKGHDVTAVARFQIDLLQGIQEFGPVSSRTLVHRNRLR